MAGIILLFSATDDISSGLFVICSNYLKMPGMSSKSVRYPSY